MRIGRIGRSARGPWAALALAGTLVAGALPRPAGAQPAGFLVQGQAPPDFALLDTAGKVVQLGDYRGRPILLSFWSCYTDTCFASLSAFTALLEDLGPRGLAAPTVCQEIPPSLAADGYAGLLGRCSAGQTILLDPDRRVGAQYFVTEFPTTYLIGPEFTIREILPGVAPLRDPGLRARIERLLGQPAPAR